MTAASGTLPWLMRHELRLLYRDWAHQRWIVVLVVISCAVMHALAVLLVIDEHEARQLPPELSLLGATAALALALLTMVARSLFLSIQALYERGDLDLLMSSPLRLETIFAARASAIALATAAGLTLLVLPFANVFVAFGHLRWAILYLVLPMLACLATSVSLWIAFGLLKLVGVRHTRSVARAAAMLVPMASLMAVQVSALVASSSAHQQASAVALIRRLPGIDSALWIPARAVMGTPVWSLVAGLLCAGMFVGSVAVLAQPFGEAVMRTGTVVAPGRRLARAMPRLRTGTLFALVRKDLRVALRDPQHAAQLFVQQLLLVTGGVLVGSQLVWRGVPMAWLMMVPGAGLMAITIAERIASNEEAPELLRSAPVGALQLLSSQLLASMTPPLLGSIACGAALALTHQGVAGWLTLCSLGNAVSQALPYLRLKRRRRRSQFDLRLLLALPLGFIQFIGFALWTGIAAIGFLLLA